MTDGCISIFANITSPEFPCHAESINSNINRSGFKPTPIDATGYLHTSFRFLYHRIQEGVYERESLKMQPNGFFIPKKQVSEDIKQKKLRDELLP